MSVIDADRTREAFLSEARAAYVNANAATLRWMLDRPRLHGAFLNTKVNSITLAEYTEDDGWRGPQFLYGWIQGRGLEALVTHALFFDEEEPELAARLHAAARDLYRSLKALHGRFGHAYFSYDANLVPVYPGSDARPAAQSLKDDLFTYSDAFVLKGLIAAARAYAPAEATAYLAQMRRLVLAIEEGRFVMDERRLLGEAALREQEDEFGPRMILVGAAAMLRRLGFDDDAAFGERFIDHVLTRHWDVGEGGSKATELVKDVAGGDHCNVGHAIELAGFGLEFIPQLGQEELAAKLERILVASFRAGFTGPGLCLRISAGSGAPLSPYFPWWSLPETVRAAALAYARSRNETVLDLWRQCHDAFFGNYWRASAGIAYQTRDMSGAVDYVPATPDLDPGYHTGLSFLSAIEAIDKLRRAG